MGIFDVFKNKEEKKVIDKDSFMSGLLEMAIREIEYVEPLLKLNNINYEFENLIASTFAYYFSIWLAYIEKNTQENIYVEIKNKMQNVSIGLITDSCISSNLSKDKYIEIFNNNFESAIIESKTSIDGETFYDKGITDKYLLSLINSQDIFTIKNQMQIRILQYWSQVASEAMKQTKIK